MSILTHSHSKPTPPVCVISMDSDDSLSGFDWNHVPKDVFQYLACNYLNDYYKDIQACRLTCKRWAACIERKQLPPKAPKRPHNWIVPDERKGLYKHRVCPLCGTKTRDGGWGLVGEDGYPFGKSWEKTQLAVKVGSVKLYPDSKEARLNYYGFCYTCKIGVEDFLYAHRYEKAAVREMWRSKISWDDWEEKERSKRQKLT